MFTIKGDKYINSFYLRKRSLMIKIFFLNKMLCLYVNKHIKRIQKFISRKFNLFYSEIYYKIIGKLR